VQPIVGGIYTSDAEKLSMQATLPRFVRMERTHGSLLRAVWEERRQCSRASPASAGDAAPASGDPAELHISGARYGLFASLAGGMSELLDALEGRIRASAHIELKSAVASLEPLSTGGYRLSAEGRPAADFEGVVLALPAYCAARLISPWDPVFAEELDHILYASSAIAVTGHALRDIHHPLDAFGLVVPRVENRRILAVSFLSRKFAGRSPEGTVQLRTFVGGALQPELLQQDDASLLAMVLEELREILGVGGKPLFHYIARYERAMPQYHVGHREQIAAIEGLERAHPRLTLAGNAYHGVGIPDCIHSGEQAAERLMQSFLPLR
jgi:oxygen-dependent protoporphyrinogen oxidase